MRLKKKVMEIQPNAFDCQDMPLAKNLIDGLAQRESFEQAAGTAGKTTSSQVWRHTKLSLSNCFKKWIHFER